MILSMKRDGAGDNNDDAKSLQDDGAIETGE